VPLKKIETKLKLLKKLSKAIKEAQKAGIHNPLGKVKKALDSRIKYKSWKDRNEK
jgi:hypothetical protein